MKTLNFSFTKLMVVLACFLPAIFINSCVEEVVPYLVVNPEQIDVGTSTEMYTVEVKSNSGWKAVSDQEWVQLSNSEGNSDGKFELKIDSNSGTVKREAIITISSNDGSLQVPVLIRQIADEAALTLTEEKVFFGKNADTHRVGVVANHDWTVSSSTDWCTAEVEEKGQKNIVISVQENATGEDRTAMVLVKSVKGVEKPVSQAIEVKQMAAENYFSLPVKDYKTGNAETILDIPYDTSDEDVEIRPSASVDWITFGQDKAQLMAADKITRKQFIVNIAENATGQARVGTITVVAMFNGKNPIKETVQIQQMNTDNTIKFSVEEAKLNPLGETMDIPFIANVKPEVSVSADWCTASVKSFENGKGVIEVTPQANFTENVREVILTAFIKNEAGNASISSLKLIQEIGEYRFNLSDTHCNLLYHSAEKYITIQAYGDWYIVEDSVPSWLEISQLNGTGDASVNIRARNNLFCRERIANIIFKNTGNNENLVLYVVQELNPYGIEDFKYLGKGFDGAGIYAHDAYVKGSVLDCEKLYHENRIADVINPNQTNEITITGSTLESYQRNYSSYSSSSVKYKRFHSSVSTNFSSRSTSSNSHSFATFRHMTKKQILKINQNETGATLRNCLSDEFIKDLSQLSAYELVKKYGTHVITGFSLGGVLEYSMSAKSSAFKSEASMGLAVQAGFKVCGIGIETSVGYNEYKSASQEHNEFEQRLLCRGGDSQYGTTVKGTPEQFNCWINSLSQRDKWIMVDYEGNKLIPLWEFVADPSKRQQIEDVVQFYLEKGYMPDPRSAKVTFTLEDVVVSGSLLDQNSYNSIDLEYQVRISFGEHKEINIRHGYQKGNNTFEANLAEPIELWMNPDEAQEVQIFVDNVRVRNPRGGHIADLDSAMMLYNYKGNWQPLETPWGTFLEFGQTDMTFVANDGLRIEFVYRLTHA